MNKIDDRIQITKELEQFGLPKHIMERIEQLQREAFMDGYQYAISLLQESMQRKGR